FLLRETVEGDHGFPASFPVGGFWFLVASGDFFGDGRDALALVVPNGGVQVYRADADGAWEAAGTFLIGSSIHSIAAGDVDGDGVDELLIVRSAHQLVLTILSPGRQAEVDVPIDLKFIPFFIGAGDLDGDGRTDIVFAMSEEIATLLAQPDGSFRPGPLSPYEGFVSSGVAVDFDGDGRMDLALSGSVTTILLGDGAGGFTQGHQFPFWGQAVAAADLDLDGHSDVLLDNFVGLTVLWGGSGLDVSSFDVGMMGAVVGDFDGDLYPDIASAGPGDTLSIVRGAGDRTFLPPIRYPGGMLPEALVFGNFTGGPLGDLVVFRFDRNIHLLPLACSADIQKMDG
ncbi:MAG TPA: VCBS repeat-containing protein, partial [Vulgatibacter sp.]